MKADADELLSNIKKVMNDVDNNTHTIFLLTEGIFNHWWDFPKESKSLLAGLTNCFDVEIWVWLRDPLSFAESYYKQNLKNPQIPNINCYGRDVSVLEMTKNKCFMRHFDYLGFLYECEELFGKNNVKAFEYDGDIIDSVCSKLDLSIQVNQATPRKNTGLSAATTNLLRIINRYPLSPADKQQILPHINKLNEILSIYSSESLIDEECRNKILEITALVNNKKLLRKFNN